MTDSEKLTMLKALIGTTSLADETLSAYLTIAGEKVLRKKYGPRVGLHNTVPEEHDTDQVQLAANMVVKRGAEGQTSLSDNGVTRTYESEDVILNRITPCVYVPGVVANEEETT